jgi:GntR family transcriptional regulator/MocR family aminotransferase
LIDEGYLLSRERSGIYINEKILSIRVGFEGKGGRSVKMTAKWRRRIKSDISPQTSFLLRLIGNNFLILL